MNRIIAMRFANDSALAALGGLLGDLLARNSAATALKLTTVLNSSAAYQSIQHAVEDEFVKWVKCVPVGQPEQPNGIKDGCLAY